MFRDTSMDYLSRDEVLEIWNNNMRLTDEQLLAMDETEFRARVRERSHHTLEIQVYATAYRHQKLKPNQADYTKHLLELWEKRGLGKNLPEYRYASFLIDAAEKLVKGEDVDLTPYKPTPVTEQMEKDFFTIVKERRSVREFKDKEVPDELIDKILEAGLWAAHGCNIQSIRYVVVREKNEPGLFRGSDVPGGPVHLVILQDMRCYRANSFTPVRNQLLDAGAAGQNIVLAAHAVGLEGVWLTFPGEEFCDRLRKKFNLPDYIRPQKAVRLMSQRTMGSSLDISMDLHTGSRRCSCSPSPSSMPCMSKRATVGRESPKIYSASFRSLRRAAALPALS